MDYPWQHIFSDFGKLVKVDGELEGFIQTLEARTVEIQDHFDDDVYDSDYQADVLSSLGSFRSGMEGYRSTVLSRVSEYVTDVNLLRLKIDSAYQVADDIIVQMIARMNQSPGYVGTDQTVRGNQVGIMLDWQETGDGFAQLANYTGLYGLSDAVMNASHQMYFDIIALGGGNFRVDIFNDAAKGAADRVGYTGSYNATGYQTVYEDNSSGLSGRIRITNVVGAASIIIQWIWLGTRTGNGVVSQFEATQMAVNDDDIILECIDATTVGAEQWRIRSRLRGVIPGTSGIITTGVAFPAADVQDLAGISVTITAGATAFAVGDSFELKTRSNDQGLFQTYFRDRYNRWLPFVLDGTETISDTLAQ